MIKQKLLLIFFLLCVSSSLWAQDSRFNMDFAWDLYVNGRYEEALEYTDKALDSFATDSTKRAPWFYLQGFTLSKFRGEKEAVLEAFRLSFHFYVLAKVTSGTDLAELGIAKLYLDEDEPTQALEYLLRISKKSRGGYFYFLLSRLEFQEGNYEQALSCASESVEIYGKDDAKEQARNRVGLLQMLTGKWEEGLNTTLTSQKAILAPGVGKRHYYYTLLNIYLYQRCKAGRNGHLPLVTVKDETRRNYDGDLERILSFVEDYPCPDLPNR